MVGNGRRCDLDERFNGDGSVVVGYGKGVFALGGCV